MPTVLTSCSHFVAPFCNNGVVTKLTLLNRKSTRAKVSSFTACKRSLGQGNIFAPVCHSVRRGVCLSACWDTTNPPGRRPPRRRPPGRRPPWSRPSPRGVSSWGVCLSACWDTTPRRKHLPWRRPPRGVSSWGVCLSACWDTTNPPGRRPSQEETPL